jgi:hypothetical protein
MPGTAGGKPPPPPPPPKGGAPGAPGETQSGLPAKKKQQPSRRLKQLHWIKVNERKVKTTIWETMEDESVMIRKEEIEQLFEAKVSAAKGSEKGEKGADDEHTTLSFGPRKKRVVVLLSANRSQTIGVLLSHLKISNEEFKHAIMQLDTKALNPNFVVQLMRLLPTDQEVAALQSYTGPKDELGVAEQFMFELLCIPRLKPRLQCFVFILEFNARLHDLSENVEVFSYAINDIIKCKKIVKLLEVILAIGNYLNGTGPRGGAFGFKLEVLTKLADTKTADNKSTLLHYIVSFVSQVYPELVTFPEELTNVEIGAKVSHPTHPIWSFETRSSTTHVLLLRGTAHTPGHTEKGGAEQRRIKYRILSIS